MPEDNYPEPLDDQTLESLTELGYDIDDPEDLQRGIEYLERMARDQ